MRILVVEDNPKMASAIEAGLREHHYSVDVCYRGFEGEEAATSQEYDVIILDVMLPDRDGRDVCRNLRKRGVTTPVIMLTAISGTRDKVEGLESGADDYLPKPFEFEELVARVRALMRRGQSSMPAKLTCDDLELDLAKRCAYRDSAPIKLSGKEFALLEYFMRNQNRVLSRSSIGQHVWDMNYEPESNVIDVYVSALRRKLDKAFARPLIHTVIGTGYRFGVLEEAELQPTRKG